MTLEQRGYKLQGQAFVKNIDSYKISLFPAGKDFIRRIIKDGVVIDIRKVNNVNLESDKAFIDILKNRALSTQTVPHIAITQEVSYEVKTPKQLLEDEVHLNKEVL